jgi:membrane-associated protein
MTAASGPSLDPQWLISAFGLTGILVIVFAECGVLLGFFLPGDSLLFTAGLMVADGTYLRQPLWLVCLLITAAAIAGDQVGYLFGRRVGPGLFARPDSRVFRQDRLTRARAFFDRYGPWSVVLARFVPVVRTFTPVVAGVAGMRYRTFMAYNALGGALWGTGVTALGHRLGHVPFVRSNVELILAGIVVVSVAPVAVHLLRGRLSSPRA